MDRAVAVSTTLVPCSNTRPVPVVLILNVIFFKLANRENLEEYKNCLENIENIVELKR